MRDGSSLLERGWALCKRPETWAFALVLAVCAASIPSYRQIPGYGRPWGLDLQNVFAFHHCASRDEPYAATGFACGDRVGRGMPYPPLLYWSFTWIRAFSLPIACWIWASFIVAGLLGSGWVWSGAKLPRPARSARLPAALFGALLIAAYPAAFAIERGNNDILVVLTWSVALLLFLRKDRFASGSFCGLAAVLKVYPAFAAFVVVAGELGAAIRGDRQRRIEALRFAGGLALAPLAVSLLFLGQTRRYITQVLPPFAAHMPAVTLHSHSVPATFGDAARPVSAALVLAWAAAAFFRLNAAPSEVFAGALAISTYVAATSFDYNLITVYPLLVVLLLRALQEEGRRAVAAWAALALGLAGVVAHRGWFTGHPQAHVVLQVVFLVASALFVGAVAPPRAATAAPARAALAAPE
jgi:hypothetical protein